MSLVGHHLPVVARQSRQLDAQKLPVSERSVYSEAIPPKAAERRQAEKGQQRQWKVVTALEKSRCYSSPKNCNKIRHAVETLKH
jgi:hypothetical protein